MVSLKKEKNLWKKGFKFVVGIDEAGRGAVAGPLFVGAVLVKKTKKNIPFLEKIKDSKKLSPKKREFFFNFFSKFPGIEWVVTKVSPKKIEKIGIQKATFLAIKRAVEKLKKKSKVDFLILDGKLKLNLKIPFDSIVKADEKIFCCALASIFAKVKRDKLMERYSKIYPQYSFWKNKGYLTKEHYLALKKYGISKIHRLNFLCSI
jgi:ribonuclease HII